jgi:hypothetical protein
MINIAKGMINSPMYFKFRITWLIAIFTLFGCTQEEKLPKIPELPPQILQNPEYQILIKQYNEEDKGSLKVHAVNYLLAYIPSKYALSGEMVQCLDGFFAKMQETIVEKGGLPEPKTVTEKWDSIVQSCQSVNQLYIYGDTEVLDYGFLKKVIDESFQVWRRSYAQHLSFQDFCEYILPYRSNIEKVEDNYGFIKDRFAWLPDSLKNPSDPVEACEWVNNDLKSWFRFHYKLNDYPGDIAISHIYKGRQGVCTDMANLACVTMRTLGIPVAVDFAPQWGNKEKGHDWNVVFDQKMKAIPFMGAETNPGEPSSYFVTNTPAKVYRRTFADKLRWEGALENIPPLFRDGNLVDVTEEYTTVSDIKIKLDTHTDAKWAFVNVFGRTGWNPIGFGEIVQGQTHFDDLGRGVVYLPTTYHSERNLPAGYPFLIDSLGMLHQFKPDMKNLETVELTRKYPLYPYILEQVDKMIGGKFQAANDPEFKNPVDLYTITERPELFSQEIALDNKEHFQYFRYLSPQGGFADVAEIEAYDRSGQLEGKVIGQTAWNIAGEAFDGNIDTFFATADAGTGEWIGLDFEKPKKITRLRFLPRNDNNYVKTGDTHELLYWDGQWKSLGQKIANAHQLIYNNVPSNALLWLRNLDYGQEERIFSYTSGTQIWH